MDRVTCPVFNETVNMSFIHYTVDPPFSFHSKVRELGRASKCVLYEQNACSVVK